MQHVNKQLLILVVPHLVSKFIYELWGFEIEISEQFPSEIHWISTSNVSHGARVSDPKGVFGQQIHDS